MHLPFLDADALRSALDYPSAVAALEAGYAGPFNVPARLQMDAGEGRLWLMPAASDDALGMKLVTQFDSNAARGIERIQGLYIYLDAETGQPLALLDGRAITGIRTAAVSALATRWMANAGPATLAVFGTGVQAGAHVVAMRALFDVRDVMVCGASLEKSRAFAEANGCRAAPREECSEASLICVCTTSRTPVLDGNRLRPGTHINAAGNSRPDSRELDSATVVRARLAVDHREGALVEAGDLLLPIAQGEIDERHIIADLPEIVRGKKVRQSPDDITLFKSVGFALGDLVLARLAYAKWSAR
jgi:ornithine cyclodeaminase